MNGKTTGFVVTTPADIEPFSTREEACDWSVGVVLGGYAPWAEMEDLASGQTFRVVGRGSVS
jgi:hypothetical protein